MVPAGGGAAGIVRARSVRERAKPTLPDYLTTLLQAPPDLALSLERRVETLMTYGHGRRGAERLALREWREAPDSNTLG